VLFGALSLLVSPLATAGSNLPEFVSLWESLKLVSPLESHSICLHGINATSLRSVTQSTTLRLQFRFVLSFGILGIFHSYQQGAFSGLLAGVIIQHLDGKRGLAGWKWLLLIGQLTKSTLDLCTSSEFPQRALEHPLLGASHG
jgi:hypothetical protein